MPLPPARRVVIVAAAAVAAVAMGVVAPTARGQLRPGWMRRGMRQPFDPSIVEQSNDRDTPVGVTVPDSPGAVERLDQAAEKERQKQWGVAADYYREAVTKFAGRVVPVEVDRPRKTFRYAGVAAVVQERIAKWPPEGLTAYRNRFGPAAADKLAAAGRGDWAALNEIFYDDFVTDAGKAAGLRLMDAYGEAGDFAAAAAVGDRLLALHPMLGADRATIVFRTALADHWGGDDSAANGRLGELRQSDPKAIGTVGGRDVVLVDALASAMAVVPPRPAEDPSAADTYPSFGGPGGRGDISPSTARPDASPNPVLLTPPEWGVPPQQQQAVAAQDTASLANGGGSGIMPVVDAGTLFFQDGRTAYAVDADSGRPSPGWLATYPEDGHGNGGRYRLSVPGRARGEQLTVTVTPAAVLAVMGQPDRMLQSNMAENGFNGRAGFGGDGMMGSNPTVRLICLDRQTGRERWRATPADLPEAAGAARAGDYVGTPLAVPAAIAGTPGEDAVLVAARGGKDAQFDDCYVVCLSARTGQYRWSTYIGSGSRLMDGDPFGTGDPSQLSLADGRALVMTNLGTVAAVDPADGRVLWLTAYPRDAVNTPEELMARQSGQPETGPSRPWARNPVVVQGGHVFALPADAKELFVLDAATGRQLARVPVSQPTTRDANDNMQHETADVLLGIRDQYAVLSGEHTIFGVDWRRYSVDRPNDARWMEQPCGNAETPDSGNVAFAARGFLTASGIFVVNKQNLDQINWQTHKIDNTYPSHGTFSAGQGAGNILVTSQDVVVAGNDRVDLYTDLDRVTAKFAARVAAAAPDDVEPRVLFAEALFAAGRPAEAVAKMDEAIDQLGGRSAMRAGPGRQLVFQTLLDFARRTAVAGTVKTDPPDVQAKSVELATGLFDRAADAADAPADRAAYLLARAKFDHDDLHDEGAEIDLCQRVLSDPVLRKVPMTDEQTAAAAATAAIGGAISVDRSAYAPVEARAAAALITAKATGDPDAVLAVADVYPNSRAAADARQIAVNQLEGAGHHDRAIDVLRQMFATAGDPGTKAAVLESVAADFLATGRAGVGPAADRLARAAQLSVDAGSPKLAVDLTLPDGTVLHGGRDTYAAAVDAVRAELARRSTAALPDFHLPTYHEALDRYLRDHQGQLPKRGVYPSISPFTRGSEPIPDVVALVHPTRGFDRNDRVITWSPAGLAVYAVGQVTPLFRSAAVTDAPLGAAWMNGKLVVWTPNRVTAVADGGRDAWPAALVVGDLQAPPAVASAAGAFIDDLPGGQAAPAGDDPFQGNRFVNVRVNGRVIVVRNGQRFVQAVAPVAPVAPPPPPVLSGDEQVAAVQPAGDVVVVATTRGRVLGVDGASGTVRWQSRPADRAADALLANGRFAIVRLDDPAGSSIAVYEAATGHVVGRQRFTSDGTPGALVNVALGEEGMIAITTAGGIEVKDLYEPWRQPRTPLVSRANPDPAGYVGLNQPDQLLVEAGRVVALYDSGRFWRAWDLSRPAAEPTYPVGVDLAPAQPGVPATTGPVTLRLDGSRLFVLHPANLQSWNVADPAADHVTGAHPDFNGQNPRLRALLLGRRHAILIDDPVDRGPAGSPEVSVIAVSRAPVPGTTHEQGGWDFAYRLAIRSGVTDWIGVDGGVYFQTGDHRLIFGSGGAAPTP
jgi:outer membrane protein assembly factor BamB